MFLVFLKSKNANLVSFFSVLDTFEPKVQKVKFSQKFFSIKSEFGKVATTRCFCAKRNAEIFPFSCRLPRSTKKHLKLFLTKPNAARKKSIFQKCRPRNPYFSNGQKLEKVIIFSKEHKFSCGCGRLRLPSKKVRQPSECRKSGNG